MTDETPSESETAAPAISVPATPATPAGWYPDPTTGQQRYWDGTTWTEHYAPAVPPAGPRKTTAPVVLGIIGVVLAFIPGALYVGIVLGILALVFGIVATRAKARRGTAALTLGIVAIVVGLLFAGVYGGGSAPSKDASDSSSVVAPKATDSEKTTSTPTSSLTPAPAPAKPSAQALTASQEQAVIAARGYLGDGQGFSYVGLLRQLSSQYGSGFPKADAMTAIRSLHVDWNEQAVISAKGYLSDGQGFSHNSLLRQLTSSYGSGFTKSQAEYALKKVGL